MKAETLPPRLEAMVILMIQERVKARVINRMVFVCIVVVVL